jgi:2,4-dienoyl-CoA reductase-like NADH-dependent reductase (Old Yellow Enzyme family)
MNFPLQVVDACCKVREKYNRPDFIIGFRLSPEEPFEDGLTMTETLKLIKALETRLIQYIHVSQYDYFRKTRRGEGAGIEKLKVIHNEIKGKIALVGIGGLNTEKDINKALDSQLSEFIVVGRASMIHRELGILLKENRGKEIEVEINPEHPEIYCMPDQLWKMSIQGISYFPPIKGKTFEGFKGDP